MNKWFISGKGSKRRERILLYTNTLYSHVLLVPAERCSSRGPFTNYPEEKSMDRDHELN